jgi:hypothetical protein
MASFALPYLAGALASLAAFTLMAGRPRAVDLALAAIWPVAWAAILYFAAVTGDEA